jgi:lipopolysaccharide/colanic/teichoic acid biosynthesis glycosyltransferase
VIQPSESGIQALGYVTDGELKALYENALCLVFPSTYEGFGMPVLEAMRCGCPVICARSGAVPEIAGAAALYFEPRSIDSISETLAGYLADPAQGDELRARGRVHSYSFSWSTTAGRVLSVLRELSAPRDERAVLGRAYRRSKWLLDLVLIVAALPALVFLLISIAVAIKLDSAGPVLYSQTRLGRGGAQIKLWKFRSMSVDAEEILQAHLERNPAATHEWEAHRKLRVDPRVTRIGKILRRTSLDELPQVWNVLRGDLSLVGPRPILPDEASLYGDDLESYLVALPGLTGLWQISGRNDLPFYDRIALDLYYVQNWSIWLDVNILLTTILAVFQGRGAY